MAPTDMANILRIIAAGTPAKRQPILLPMTICAAAITPEGSLKSDDDAEDEARDKPFGRWSGHDRYRLPACRVADNRHVHQEYQEERHAHDDEENARGMDQGYHALVTTALALERDHFDDPARHAGKEGSGVIKAAYPAEVNVADRARNVDVDRDPCERYWLCKQLAKRVRREGTSQNGSVRQEDRYPRYGTNLTVYHRAEHPG